MRNKYNHRIKLATAQTHYTALANPCGGLQTCNTVGLHSSRSARTSGFHLVEVFNISLGQVKTKLTYIETG